MTLKEILDVAKINSADDENKAIAEMLKPTNRKAASRAYIDVLGYDPTRYFDEQEIRDILDKYIEAENATGIKSCYDEIVIAAMSSINDGRTKVQVQAIKDAIEQTIDKDTSDDFSSWVTKTHLVVDEDDDDDVWDDEDDDDIEDEIDISDDNILGGEDDDED